MASCAITIGGTSGSVLIRYKLGGVNNSITANFGTEVYVSNTITDVTYTTLSGDANASSGCVSITELEETCYEFKWETLKAGCDRGDVINAVIVGSTAVSITPKSISTSYQSVADAISTASSSLIQPYAGKFTASSTGTGKNYLIAKVYGADTLISLRVYNASSGFYYNILGTPTTCTVPSGYTAIETCIVPESEIEI